MNYEISPFTYTSMTDQLRLDQRRSLSQMALATSALRPEITRSDETSRSVGNLAVAQAFQDTALGAEHLVQNLFGANLTPPPVTMPSQLPESYSLAA